MKRPAAREAARRPPAGPRFWWRVVFCCGLGCLAALPVASAPEPVARRVLLLYPESFYRPAVVAFDAVFRRRVTELTGPAVEFDMENIGPPLRDLPDTREALQGWLRACYSRRSPDVVVAAVPEVFDCLTNAPTPLFPSSRLLLLGTAPDDAVPGNIIENTVSVVWQVNAAATLELALRLQPETRRVVVVYGSSSLDGYYARRILKELEAFHGRIEVEALTGLSLEAFEERLASLPPRTVAIYNTIDQDVSGRRFIPREVLVRLRQASRVPIYSMYSTYLGHGIVGGCMTTFEEVGERAAGLVARMLAADGAGSMPRRCLSFPGRLRVDWRELRHWDLPVSRLPPGTLIINQPSPVWVHHRRETVTGLAVIALLLAGVVVLALQQRRLRQTRALLARERNALQGSQMELRHLAERLLRTDEAERTRLARELHDDISQRLAALVIGMDRLEASLDHPGETEGSRREAFAALKQALAGVAGDLHGMARRLHPAILDDLGLVRAIGAACEAFTRIEGLAVRFYSDGVREPLPQAVALCLYRIAQEGLNNAARHSGAKEVSVFVNGGDTHVELLIEDEGRGFDAEAVRWGAGMGLIGMRERVRLVHGRLDVFSQPGEGTSIRVRIPLRGETTDET